MHTGIQHDSQAGTLASGKLDKQHGKHGYRKRQRYKGDSGARADSWQFEGFTLSVPPAQQEPRDAVSCIHSSH